MLIDLGRNDVGRVARIGSVRVTDRMIVERYSHVMHIVLERGRRAARRHDRGRRARARPSPRAPSRAHRRSARWRSSTSSSRSSAACTRASATSLERQHDTAIAIRTAVIKDGQLHIQGGRRGIVGRLRPQLEWDENHEQGPRRVPGGGHGQAGIDRHGLRWED